MLQPWLEDTWARNSAHAEVLALLTTLVDQRLVATSGAFRQLAEVLMARRPVPEAASLALLAALASEGESKSSNIYTCRTRHVRMSGNAVFSLLVAASKDAGS